MHFRWNNFLTGNIKTATCMLILWENFGTKLF